MASQQTRLACKLRLVEFGTSLVKIGHLYDKTTAALVPSLVDAVVGKQRCELPQQAAVLLESLLVGGMLSSSTWPYCDMVAGVGSNDRGVVWQCWLRSPFNLFEGSCTEPTDVRQMMLLIEFPETLLLSFQW